MTSKEAYIKLKEYNNIGLTGDNTLFEPIRKDLEILDLYKKFFKYSLTEIQGIKYLVLPNSDIRRPDSMLKITDGEYEILKEGLENEKL